MLSRQTTTMTCGANTTLPILILIAILAVSLIGYLSLVWRYSDTIRLMRDELETTRTKYELGQNRVLELRAEVRTLKNTLLQQEADMRAYVDER